MHFYNITVECMAKIIKSGFLKCKSLLNCSSLMIGYDCPMSGRKFHLYVKRLCYSHYHFDAPFQICRRVRDSVLHYPHLLLNDHLFSAIQKDGWKIDRKAPSRQTTSLLWCIDLAAQVFRSRTERRKWCLWWLQYSFCAGFQIKFQTYFMSHTVYVSSDSSVVVGGVVMLYLNREYIPPKVEVGVTKPSFKPSL